jgi:hypothetical protein
MLQNGHMTTMAIKIKIDEHVPKTRGGLTMEMEKKDVALFFPLNHQPPFRILICAAYIRVSNTHYSSSFFQDVLPSYKNSIVLVA